MGKQRLRSPRALGSCRRGRCVPRLVAACVALLLAWSADAGASPRAEILPPDTGEDAEPKPAEFPGRVALHEGLLAVFVRDVPLAKVLEEIGRRSAVRIFSGLSLDERVSADFEGVPLEDGLQRLLRGQNVVLVYRQPESSGRAGAREAPPSLATVIVWPRDGRPGLGADNVWRGGPAETAEAGGRPAGNGAAADLGQLGTDAIHEPEPEGRQQALVALGKSGQADAVSPLLAALQDREPTVRNAAVEAVRQLLKTSSPDLFPTGAVVQLAARDGNAEVRIAALEILQQIVREWEDGGAMAELDRASRAVDHRVKAAASRLLADLRPTPGESGGR